MNTPPDYDVAICGAGPAGMALAALLAQRGMTPARIALIDAKSLAQASLDPRSLALSWGSRQILDEVQAWPRTATAIHQIHVSRRGRFGRSLIDRVDHGVPALGYVSRYGDVVTALGAACDRLGVKALRAVRVIDRQEDADAVTLTLDTDGAITSLRAAVVVQAEGGLFGPQQEKQAGQRRDYGQSAIIAEVRSSAPPPHRAYERFTDEGPLALLPLGDAWSLVWCVRPERAQELLALDDAAFLARLGEAFGERVGRFTGISARNAYPLGLSTGWPADAGAGRSVAIGNAAQILHPVAGQGLNLGLRDAAVLARLLACDAAPGPAALAAFVAERRADRVTTVKLTDTMARVFTIASPLQSLLGASLGALDMFSPLRHLLAEQMMYGRR
jgi:2-octaprenyl-6-methoxyphenol hydroxylase